MNKINLSSIGIEFLVPDIVDYKDAGEVEDVNKYALGECSRIMSAKGYASAVHRLSNNMSFPLGGICIYGVDNNKVNIRVATRKDLPELLKLHAKGHEETHVIQHLMKKHMLFELLFAQHLLKNTDPYSLRDEELISDMGGHWAVFRKHGMEGLKEFCSKYQKIRCLLKL